MFKTTPLETKDGQKLALCMDCGFHILVNVIRNENASLEWDPSPAERRHWTDHPEIKWKGGNGGPHLCGPNQIEDVTVLTMRSDTVKSSHETIDSVGNWAVETFGAGSDPAVFAKRILSETMEFAYLSGVYPGVIKGLIEKEWRKFEAEYLIDGGHVGSDFNELKIEKDRPKELADIAITVYAAAKQLGIDLVSVLDHAMAINRTREWTCHGDGTGKYSRRSPLEDQRSSDQPTLRGSEGTNGQGVPEVHQDA